MKDKYTKDQTVNKNPCTTDTSQIQEVTGYCAHQFKLHSRVTLSETEAHFNQLALHLYLTAVAYKSTITIQAH